MEQRLQLDLSKKLKEKRNKIDEIDRKIVALLNQRLCIALEAGEIKKKRGEKIYDPRREKEVLEQLTLKNRGLLKNEDLENIFRVIIKVCRQSQNGMD
jgi:chorismate mutase